MTPNTHTHTHTHPDIYRIDSNVYLRKPLHENGIRGKAFLKRLSWRTHTHTHTHIPVMTLERRNLGLL